MLCEWINPADGSSPCRHCGLPPRHGKPHTRRNCLAREQNWGSLAPDDVRPARHPLDAALASTVSYVMPGVPAGQSSHETVLPYLGVGPGTELHKKLAIFGIHPTPGCSCNSRMAMMNERGCQWCRENIDTIVGWMEYEARQRKLPFSRPAAKVVVKWAIRTAEKKAAKHSARVPA